MTDKKIVLLKNEFWNFYVIDKNLYIHTTTKQYQEENLKDCSRSEKEYKRDQILEYFKCFWKTVESTGDIYTMYFNANTIIVNTPVSYYMAMGKILKSLKGVFEKNLKESHFKIENNFTKSIFNLVLSFYTPVKPVHVLNG